MAPPDATKLAERLQGLGREDSEEYWVHVVAASPLEKYPAKSHARRVRDKLDVAEGLIYLPGAPARNNEDSDMPAPFRQRRYFYYLSGCNEADCHVTYDIQHDILALFIPRIDPARVIWNGHGSTPAEAMDRYDIDEVHYVDELQKELIEWQFRYRGDFYVLHKDQAPKRPSRFTNLDTASLQPAMNLTRMIKDEHEIKLIRKANDISSEAHKQVLANITKFKNESQVEGIFMDVCISKQAKQQAYDPIAASGPNAGTLHYDANNEDFEDRQLMCLDAGCEFENYASDITRTFPLFGSWPSSEAENIYKLVQRMQETTIERLEPGVRYLDLHILAHQIAIDGLLQLGILHNGTKEEIYNAGTSRAFFPHGLGHHVGLEVHDVGQQELMSFYEKNPRFANVPSLYPEDFHLPVYDNQMCRAPSDPGSPHLEEGMVVTVEPGIYFSAYALSHFFLPSPIHNKYINARAVNKYLPVGGVRIEDDILITSKGYENLTTAPKGEAMLEIIRTRNASWPLVPAALKNETFKRPEVDEEPLMRAPGISKRMGEPRIKLMSRASTVPVVTKGDRKYVDFEPFDGPSLFSGFAQPVAVEKAVTRPSPSSVRDPYGGAPSSVLINAATTAHAREMQQIRPRPCQVQTSCAGTSQAHNYDAPNRSKISSLSSHKDLKQESRGKASVNPNVPSVPIGMPQRRYSTLDNYVEKASPVPAQQRVGPSSNPWSQSVPVMPCVQRSDPCANFAEHAPSAQQTSGLKGLPAVYDRAREAHLHPSTGLRTLALRPSMPIFQSSERERDPRISLHASIPVQSQSSALHQPREQPRHFTPNSYPDSNPTTIVRSESLYSQIPSLPEQSRSYMPTIVSSNPWQDAAATATRVTTQAAAFAAPFSSYEESVRMLRDQKMEELRRAMEMVWKVKEDLEKTFGDALGGGGKGSA